MKKMQKWVKYVISISYDILDFTIGRIPIFGTLFDVIGGILAINLWGSVGAIQFLEVLDPTDQIDSLIPALTIAGLLSEMKK